MIRTKAFTLIELLVVIAIIAILAAILFPVFAQAKLAAKKTAGLAQMKQVGTAAQIYLADNDDVFPVVNRTYVPAGWGTQTAFQLPSWLAHLHPYSKNVQMLYAPGGARVAVSDNTSNINLMLPGFTGSWNNNFPNPAGTLRVPTRSLGANEFIVHRLNQAMPENNSLMPIPVNASQVAQHSSTPFIADCASVLFNGTERIMAANYMGDWWNITSELSGGTAPDTLNPALARYSGGSVVIFADTSARYRPQRSLGLDRTRNAALANKLRWSLPLDPIEDDRLQ